MIRQICPKAQIFEWEIPSSTGKGKYTVHKRPGRFTCTCKGFIYYQRCKHVDLISSACGGTINISFHVCLYVCTYNMNAKHCPACGSELIFDYSELEIGNEAI